MSAIPGPVSSEPVVYPESDGKPMAENTLQYQWIVYFRENIATMFADRSDVLVAADNFIYPVEGRPRVTTAPDVYVAIGRPAGHRSSYRVWDEGNVFPQVVIEVVSPGNSFQELQRKREFYRRYGAEEYYLYDPDDDVLEVWVRDGRRFVPVDDVNGWTSPRLNIRFDTSGTPLAVFGPDGEPFLSHQELKALRKRADEACDRANAERDQARAEADKLRAKLRELGIDPDAP